MRPGVVIISICMSVLYITRHYNKIYLLTYLLTYIFEKFFTIEKIWDGLPFFSQEMLYHVRTEMRQSLALLSTVMLDH